MTETNTENTDKTLENSKQVLLNNYKTFSLEHYNEELLYPIDELEKWKRKLKTIRSKMDNKLKIDHTPLRRSAKDYPLLEVFKDIMNRDSFTNLANEINVDNTTPTKAHCSISTENKVKSVGIKNTNNFQNPIKPLSAEKTNTINAKEANKNAKCLSNVAKTDCVTKKNIASTKKTRSLQSSKKKTIIRKDIVHIDKTK